MAKKKTAGAPDTAARGGSTDSTVSPRPTRKRAPARRSSGTSPAMDVAADRSEPQDMADAAAYAPSDQEIAEAAYHRYERRGGDHGRDFDDWIEAERELRARAHRK